MRCACQPVTLLLFAVAIAGCGDPDPKTAPVTRWPYGPSFPTLTLADVTQPLVEQGFELKESRAQSHMTWNCTLRKSDNTVAFVRLTGSAPDNIEEIHSAFMNFGKANLDADAQHFFVQLVRSAYRGRRSAEVASWVRDNTGRGAIASFDGIEFRMGTTRDSMILWIRPDPEDPRNADNWGPRGTVVP